MIKLTIALAASLTLAGAAGAQMTGGNSMSDMQSGSTSTKAPAKATMHKKRVVTHKTTHHTTTTTGAGAMSNSM